MEQKMIDPSKVAIKQISEKFIKVRQPDGSNVIAVRTPSTTNQIKKSK